MQILQHIPVALLAPLVVLASLFAVRAQLQSSRLRAQLSALQMERADSLTKLLPQTAIPLRLEPELAWAHHEQKPVGILVFQVYGNRPERAARSLRSTMRGEENAYLLSPSRFLLGLWDTSETGASVAVQRLGGSMRAAGTDVIDAGLAMFPRDGTELEDLVETATAELRPLEQQLSPQEDDEPKLVPSPAGRALQVFGVVGVGALPPLALLLATYAHFLGGTLTTRLVTAGAYAAGATAVAAWVWARRPGREPRSTGTGKLTVAGLALTLVVALALLLPYAVRPQGGALAIAATLLITFHIGLIALVLAEGRYLVRLRSEPLIAALAVSAVVLAFTYQHHLLVANCARIGVAMTLGAVLARAMERMWWVVVVSMAIAVVDAWSVFGKSGTTKHLEHSQSNVLNVLLYTGPQNVYELGTTDLTFCCVFLAFAHFWRMSLARTICGIAGAGLISFLVAWRIDAAVPVLPSLSAMFLVVHADRLWAELRDALGGGAEPAPAPERVPA